jgi:TolA-binding protein
MRSHLLGLILLAGVAMPAIAQQPGRQPQQIDRRVEKLEEELRAVQRRVFPGGNVEPEISSAAPQGGQAGPPASSAVADLTARVDALESQLAAITGQAEANGNRLRQIEDSMNRLRESVGARLDVLERGSSPAPAASILPSPPPPAARSAATPGFTRATPPPPARSTPAANPAPASAEGAEDAYNEGFHLWEQKRYAEAEQSLEAMARAYPHHRLASWAKNLAGRAYLDEGKPATAARMFLANYQDNPRGERAADSLFYLGQALAKLNKPADACKAYDELQDVYGQSMRDYLKQHLPAARSESHCR